MVKLPVQGAQSGYKRPKETKYLRAIKGPPGRKRITVRIQVQDSWYTALVDSRNEGNYVNPLLVNRLRLL